MFDFKSVPRSVSPVSDKPKSGLFSFVGRWLKRICTTLGALILISSVSGCVLGAFLPKAAEYKLPEQMVLVLKLSDGLSDTGDAGAFVDPFAEPSLTLPEIVQAFHKAAQDNRVKGVLVSLPAVSLNVSHVQELRAAIAAFRATGKFAKIYSPDYGDGDGLSRYYLASAFGEIWMQPLGTVMLQGLSGEQPFFRTALDKLGIKPEILQRKEYKTAFENFTNAEMSPANRAMTELMLNDLMKRVVSDIAKDRKMSEADVRAAVDKGILLGTEALNTKFITRLDYGDKIIDETRKAVTGKDDQDDELFVTMADYAHIEQKGALKADAQKIAIIYVSGEIASTAGNTSPLSGGQEGSGADEISGALLDAAQDDTIKGVIMRVDSPGGSPSASETIRHAVQRVQKEGKFVIVSMGPLAASGGYWISANADEIFATPSTLTGSIGVVGGKADLSAMWDKLSVKWDGPQVGENADMLSFNKPMDALAAERMNAMMDDVYNNFTRIVAEGRKIDPQAVEMIARGRVWTGAQGKDIGLVDQLGGLRDALASAAKRLNVASIDDLDVVVLPEPTPIYEKILSFLEKQSSVSASISRFMHTVTQSPLARVMVYDPSVEFIR